MPAEREDFEMQFARATGGLDRWQFKDPRAGVLGIVMWIQIIRVQLEPICWNLNPAVHVRRTRIWLQAAR